MVSEKPPVHSTVLFSLLYPAILGAIFYNALPLFFDLAKFIEFPWQTISVIAILVYFVVDYLYVFSFPTYSKRAVLIDILVLIFIYRAESLLNPANGKTMTVEPAMFLAIAHILLLGWCILERQYDHLVHDVAVLILLGICMAFPHPAFLALILLGMCVSNVRILQRRRNRDHLRTRAQDEALKP
jgi:hypothetical protein